jgi:hypothetical protein
VTRAASLGAVRPAALAPREGSDQESEEDSRVSGVVRVARAMDRTDDDRDRRSTIPAPMCRVTDADPHAIDIYARIIDGKLARVFDEPLPALRGIDPARATTLDQFLAVGSLDRIPVRTCSASELRMATIDHRKGFVLSLVDGATPIESIIDATPMAMHQVLTMLTDLLGRGLIGFRS